MLFTDGKLRSFEQLMRQKPRRPQQVKREPTSSSFAAKQTHPPTANKESADEKQK